jgi:hypothetical protein
VLSVLPVSLILVGDEAEDEIELSLLVLDVHPILIKYIYCFIFLTFSLYYRHCVCHQNSSQI